jgi:hypothetical protein
MEDVKALWKSAHNVKPSKKAQIAKVRSAVFSGVTSSMPPVNWERDQCMLMKYWAETSFLSKP